MKLDRSIILRAGAVATALAFATPALPCGDKAMTTTQTTTKSSTASKTKGAVASAQATKVVKDKSAKATQ